MDTRTSTVFADLSAFVRAQWHVEIHPDATDFGTSSARLIFFPPTPFDSAALCSGPRPPQAELTAVASGHARSYPSVFAFSVFSEEQFVNTMRQARAILLG